MKSFVIGGLCVCLREKVNFSITFYIVFGYFPHLMSMFCAIAYAIGNANVRLLA